MSTTYPKVELKPIETCPNGHMYNTMNYGDTCPICKAKIDETSQPEQDTTEQVALSAEEWVCGWLVCTSGVNKGRSYEILAGKNPIGSDWDMSVRILGDSSIEKRDHSVIVYDPKKIKATLLYTNSRGIVYVEDNAVFSHKELESHAKIQIGDSDFIYVELCGEKFDWKQELSDTILSVLAAKPRMSAIIPKIQLKPIELCPNGHYYNASRDGDTCPVCKAKIDLPSRMTKEEITEQLVLSEEKWVCGWLVCIDGVNKGKSYAIHSGKNSIGNDRDMPIYISGDMSVEKRTHGVIVYDPKKVKMTMLNGNSRGLVYVEEEIVLAERDLESHERIQLGKSQFIYVALCNDIFDWYKNSK